MKLVENCPVCNSAKLRTLKKCSFKASKKIPTSNLVILIKEFFKNSDKADFTISSCQKCDFIFLNPIYLEEDLNLVRGTQKNTSKKQNKLKSISPNQLIKSKQIKKLIEKYSKFGSHRKPKILDVGGGDGSLLYRLREDFECYVLDIRKYSLPKGVNYIAHNLGDLEKNEKFENIIIIHTLEHVCNPKELLEELSNHLTENGIIIIKVPLGCIREWKSLNHPFGHINFFSELSLFNCVSLVGLNVFYIKTSILPRTMSKSWELTLVATNRQKGSFKENKVALSRWQQKSRLYFYLTVILRKEYIKKLLK